MDRRPEWTTEQLEALESLRSAEDAGNDPALAPTLEALQSDPALAQRYERIRGWDARISEAIRDVPVPPALAEQILQRLEAGPAPHPNKGDSRRPAGRRRLLWTAVAIAATAAVVLIAVTALISRPPAIDEAALLATARAEFLTNQNAAAEATPAGQEDAPRSFPYSSDLIKPRGTQWRSLRDFAGTKAVAYDIPLSNGRKATLYAVRCRAASLPARPPAFLSPQTGNLAVVAWRAPAKNRAYVLVVEGGESSYRELLRSTSRQLT